MQRPMESHSEEAYCHVEGRLGAVHKAVDPQRLVDAPLVYLLIRGMGCPACAMRVRNALVEANGVLAADVFLEQGLACVLYDPAQIAVEELPRHVAAADAGGRHHYTAQIVVFSG